MRGLFRHKVCEYILVFLCIHLVFFPILGTAKPIHKDLIAPSANTLPVLVSGQTQSGWSSNTDDAGHYLQVNQTSSKVIIQWQSFDIGSDASVHFEQPSNSTALNRIYDNDPSQIFGTLTATGNVYLINQNGILFGESSRVNLNSLVASALNIQDDEFINTDSDEVNEWHFSADNYMNDSRYTEPGDVENRGSLTSDYSGRIFLLGNNVQNSGTITAEGGWIALAGASEFEVESEISSNGYLVEYVDTDYSGTVVNTSDGQILADVGEVGLYGKIIRHNGLIRALSTVKTGSSIKLVASQSITTGKNSTIDSGVEELEDETIVEDPFPNRKVTLKSSEDSEGILIAHYGEITMPSGDVSLNAGDGGRIYLGPDSSIDVSGSWETKQVEDLIMSVQLNSIELRDEFLQKNGTLQGETVYFLITEGVSIGNISEHLASRILSALEESASGGTVTLTAGDGDIIVDAGASIDISGGGVFYEEGYVTTSKLIYGGIVYDISEAPDSLEYDQVVYDEEKYQEKISAFTEGADAGTLTMVADQVVYEGSLDGSVTRGFYQVNRTNPVDDLGYQMSVGTVIPTAGSLIIGKKTTAGDYYSADPVVDSIVIMNTTAGISSGFDPETSALSSLRNGETWLSDDLLNDSGLANVSLYATTGIVTEKNTEISLAAGGSLEMTARRILHQGEIYVSSGTVTFKIQSNLSSDELLRGTGEENPDYVSKEELGPERIELADGSVISTAGEQVNNRTAVINGGVEAYQATALTDGGTIQLLDKTNDGEGVVIREDSLLDVSGGYLIGFDQDLEEAGDAGSIEILGSAIVLEGELKGQAMIGQNGGSIDLHAYEVTVVRGGSSGSLGNISSEDSLPDELLYNLVLDDGQFEGTGFSRITLSAYSDLTLEKGVSLSPSGTRLDLTTKGAIREVELTGDETESYLGDTSIRLTAGNTEGYASYYQEEEPDADLDAELIIKNKASVTVAPGGSITLEGTYADISGTFTAPAGTIAVSAAQDLLLRSGSRFYAGGFNRISGYLDSGDVIWDTLDGGDITFEAGNTLAMKKGSVADVSGGEQVLLYRSKTRNKLTAYIGASSPGSVTLSFGSAEDENGNSLISGSFTGKKYLDSLQGASLTINHTDPDGIYTLDADLMEEIEDNGFDSLTLASLGGIDFSGSMTVTMERSILIDAPELLGTDEETVSLNSSWIRLTNTYWPETSVTSSGSATLAVNAEFIDITGSMATSGFSEVYLSAEDDIRLTDYYYTSDITGEAEWAGLFSVENNLTLTAARIYPTTASEFTISAGEKITILPSGNERTDPIYSALGSLTIEAKNIEHQGYLAAPLGRVILSADIEEGRVYLGEDSVITVSGDIAVNYGAIDEETLEWYGEKQDGDEEVDTIPEQSVDILGAEVIAAEGSEINIEGGGAIYGYSFLGSTSGSLDPLSVSGRYVILPYTLADLPGTAIFLEGNDLVEEGVYVLLPESYAFMEGALIIEYQGALDPDTVVSDSAEGYVQAVGYMGDAGSLNYSTDAGVYTIREASDVLSEGEYTMAAIEAGNAGALTVVGTETAVLDGEILAGASSDEYRGGILNLISKEVIVGAAGAGLGGSFTYDTSLEEDEELSKLINTLYLDAEQLSQAGLWELNIGVEGEDLNQEILEVLELAGYVSDEGVIAADTITFEENSLLEVQQISVIAENDITLESGAGVSATGDYAYVNLVSVSGGLVLDQGSYIESDNLISLDANSLDRKGRIKADQAIQILSEKLYLADASHEELMSEGLVVDQELWESFSSLDTVWLTGREEVGFLGNVSISAQEAIVIDSPLTAGVTEDSTTVSLTADEVYLYNSQEDSTGSDLYEGFSATLTANADTVYLGYGNIQISGFDNVNLNALNNLIFLGEGSFNTGNANLNITSAMVTGSYRTYTAYTEEGEEEEVYEALNFQVDSGAGNIVVDQGIGEADTVFNIGGSLEFTGNSISHSGTISLDSGYIGFISTGTGSEEGIFIKDGARVLARGSQYDDVDYDGGAVVYTAEGTGTVSIAQGSLTDVSAGSDAGNAGTIAISVPQGDLLVEGELKGESVEGEGGSFLLDSRVLADASDLIDTLTAGGFDQEIDMRVRQGDVSLAADVTAYHFRLSVDEGSVDVDGIIDASDEEGGGLVEIYAGGDLTLSSSTEILARGTEGGAVGGEIILANATSSGGYMDLGGAVLDVSGNGEEGGSVYIRVSRNETNDGVNLNPEASFKGAGEITVEGTAFYTDGSVKDDNFDTDEVPYEEAVEFMDTMVTVTSDDGETMEISLQDYLKSSASGDLDGFSLAAGIEYWYDGNMKWYDDMDFSSWRLGPDGTPIALTLRASGNLTIDGDIIDAPTDINSGETLVSATAQDSTRIALVAGATLSSADPFAVENGVGELLIDSEEVVYTESGDINFASGAGTTIEKTDNNHTDYMTLNDLQYSLGTYTGTIRGKVGEDLVLEGGVIQTATGDIVLDIGEDLILEYASNRGLGTIRTTGEPISGTGQELIVEHEYLTANYSNGGGITITARGDVLVTTSSGRADIELIDSDAWDDMAAMIYDAETGEFILQDTWTASYDGLNATQGIAAMADGDVSIEAGGDVLAAAGTFGAGDLSISAGGDINGRFLNYEGKLVLMSMGSIGTLSDGQVIEAFDSRITLVSQGNITLASVINPGITSEIFNLKSNWNLGYTDDTSVAMTARTGSITLTGSVDDSLEIGNGQTKSRLRLLPANVYMSAGTDIVLGNDFYMAPSSTGSLELYAGRDIYGVEGDESITMSDADPDEVYGDHSSTGAVKMVAYLSNKTEHGTSVLHETDANPAIIQAQNDIRDISFILPKAVTLTAGNDINDIYLYSQNIRGEDTTLVYAGNDMSFQTEKNGGDIRGISVGGPGLTIVQAGGNIDLGTSEGIMSTGSSLNSLLSEGSNALVVMAGISDTYDLEYLNGFFEALIDAGSMYAELQAAAEILLEYGAGSPVKTITESLQNLYEIDAAYAEEKDLDQDTEALAQALLDEADMILATVRAEWIMPLLEGASEYGGNISLINSRIYTSGGEGSIYLLASGAVDVGISSVEAPPILNEASEADENSGIYTTAGGNVNLYAGSDINVNQSRVMSFDGGDIVLWSDYGNINAGYGSKAAVASSDTYYVKNEDGTYDLVYEVPAVGSGVRATATDVDDAGDIYAFAPSGVIDAGEAGISGKNVTIGGKDILNIGNIESTGLTVGFTKPSDASASVSGLSGSSGLADAASMMDEESSALASAKDRMGEETPEGYSYEPRWVDVEVIGFEDEENDEG